MTRNDRKATRRKRKRRVSGKVRPAAVSARELRALRREIEQRMRPPDERRGRKRGAPPMRWNPDPDEVQRSVARLVLTIVEFLRRLMERQAIRRMEQRTLSRREAEAVGTALMRLEATIQDIGKRFGLTAGDLNLDLGPAGKLM